MSGFGVILGQYVRRALAYRWIVLVPTVLVFALVTFYLAIQPDTYETHAVLMAPLTESANPDARRDARDMQRATLRSASERLLSSRMLLEVVDQVDPYPEIRRTQGPEAALEKLRENVRISVNTRAGVITVTCTHQGNEHPAQMAADVVNTLTKNFIDMQVEAIIDNVTKQKNFLDTEKARLRKELDGALASLDEFKATNAGSLPDDVPTNEARVDRLRRDLVEYRSAQRSREFEIGSLRRDLARLDAEMSLLARGERPSGTSALEVAERTLASLELDLNTLLQRYGEEHAEVVKLRQRIKALNDQISDLRSEHPDNTAIKAREDVIRYLIDDNTRLIKQYKDELDEMDKAIAETQKEIDATTKRILRASTLESVYMSRQRDVSEADSKYERILARHAAIELMINNKRFDKTAPIQIEQSAFVPPKPASPNRLLTSMVGLLLGLGIGVGLAIALNKLDKSYQRPEDLRGLLPGAVLVTIPEVRASSVRLGRAILGILAGLVLTGIFAAAIAVLGIQAGWWGAPEMIQPLIDLR
jgi:uncharacterized protein involved in exopolysaccharide biosynthesis